MGFFSGVWRTQLTSSKGRCKATRLAQSVDTKAPLTQSGNCGPKQVRAALHVDLPFVWRALCQRMPRCSRQRSQCKRLELALDGSAKCEAYHLVVYLVHATTVLAHSWGPLVAVVWRCRLVEFKTTVCSTLAACGAVTPGHHCVVSDAHALAACNAGRWGRRNVVHGTVLMAGQMKNAAMIVCASAATFTHVQLLLALFNNQVNVVGSLSLLSDRLGFFATRHHK